MDPNRALVKIREHVRVIEDKYTMPATRASHGEWLAEAIEELDTWLSRGGYPPAAWAVPDVRPNPWARGEDAPLLEEVQRELDAHPTWRGQRLDPRDPASPAYERCGTVTRDGYRGDRRHR